MKAIYTLIFVLLAGTAYGQSNLPACQGNDVSKWSNCIGQETINDRHQYKDEFLNGQRHGFDVLDVLYLDFKGDKYVVAFLTKFQEVGTATYSLLAGSSIYSEGFTATLTITTTNVTSGTSVPSTLSGVSAADVSGGLISGKAVVNSSGVATISVTLLNENITECSETLTVTAS
jgi:hypothetical protein